MSNIRPMAKLLSTPIPEQCIHPAVREKIIAPTQVRSAGVYALDGVYPFMNWAGSKAPLMRQYLNLLVEEFSGLAIGCLGGGSLFLYLLGQGMLKDKPVVAVEAGWDIWNLWTQLQQAYPQKIMQVYREIALEVTAKAIRQIKLEEPGRKKKGKPKYPHLDLDSLRPQETFLVVEEEYDLIVELYNQARRANVPDARIRRAIFTLYLSKTAYNGLYRVRKGDGGFNTPWGKRRMGMKIITEAEIMEIHSALQGRGIEFIHNDFGIVASDRVKEKLPREGVFGWFDPPYETDYAKLFTSYTKGGWGRLETYRLQKTLQGLDRSGWNLMLSNACFPDVARVFGQPGFNRGVVYRHAFMRKKLGTSNNEMRAHVPEYLFRNYRTPGDEVFFAEAPKVETLQSLIIKLAREGARVADAFNRMSVSLFVRPGEGQDFADLSKGFAKAGLDSALAFRALADLHYYQDEAEEKQQNRPGPPKKACAEETKGLPLFA